MFCAPSRTTSERGKPRLAQRLTSFSRQSSSVTSRLNLVSNQADQPPRLVALGRAGPSRPGLGVGLLEMVGDRLAVADGELAVDQHRRLEAGLSRSSSSGMVPGLDLDQLGGQALLAQHDPDLAAERAQGDVVEAEHGQLEAGRARPRSC